MGAIFERLRNLIPSVRAAKRANLKAAGDHLLAEFRATLGVQGSPSNRSRPGEAPRMQTGRFRDSISVHVDDGFLAIRSSAGKLAGYLNDGTGRMAPRPYRDIALRRARPRMLELLKGR